MGDGGMRPQFERLGTEGVRFWGIVSESKKASLIQQSRALVMPSRKEGFGLVYLEAMRLGRPCLVSCDAGQEVVSSAAGVAVDPSDSYALTDALVRLLTDSPVWTAWSVNARQRYAARFTASAYQERIITPLSSFITGDRPNSGCQNAGGRFCMVVLDDSTQAV